MKILIDGRSMTSQISGIGRYTLELTKAYVAKFGENNVTVIVNYPPTYLPYKWIKCPYDRHSFIDNLKFSAFLAKQDYDIYHSGDLIGPFWHKSGKQHIITVHDLMFFIVPDFFSMGSIRAYLRKCRIKPFFKYMLHDADLIVSVSQATHEDLKRIYGYNSIVVREGINQIAYGEDPEPYDGLKPNSYFLYVGLGAPHKNIQFMIDAFLKAKTDRKLVICGKGHTPVDSQRIIYLGFVSDRQLSYLYQNCAAFIFPSKYEGFGLPILEALSHHCKVFSSNAGSLGEFSKGIIYFFNPYKEEELLTLIENCDSIHIDEKKIDNYLQHFEWKNIWNEFFSEYIK